MFSCRFYLFCLVSFLCICVRVGSSNVKNCVEKDREVLLKVKAGFIDESGTLSSWKGLDCCKWEGITCDNSTGHVTRLDLQYQGSSTGTGVRGKIDTSLCELQHLTSLNLIENSLEGKIPKCIGSLGQLIELKLANNDLVSDIPHALANLSNLESLNLGYNIFLVSNDLAWVSRLSKLRYLDLSGSNLSQAVDWLSSISKLPSLLQLELNYCELPQFTPESIPQMNSSTPLNNLNLEGNYINSLSWVLNISRVVTYLDLSHNYLQHSISEGFGHMVSLQYLDLSSNELVGSIPKSFQNLCQLKTLKLSSNKLSGQLSDNIRHLCSRQNSIEELDLSNNPFSSEPLIDFPKLSSLKSLSLHNTSMVGPLSQSFSELLSLEELDISHNLLNGTLPYAIGQLSNLNKLSLYSNKLNGVINEAHLSNLSQLEDLFIDQNSLSFNLSSNWVPPFQLLFLSASSCNLGPDFPSWLKYQKNLELLEISNCGISDSFPEWFWNLTIGLIYLNVSHNKLSGVLPKSIPSIQIESPLVSWDLSFNSLSGPLSHFPPQLSILSISNNMFSGSISSICAASFPNLAYLDISNNFFEGRLLDHWGQFPVLKALNLAKNNFSGRIPMLCGNLQQIESLHLNNNNFSGEIPYMARCSNLKLIDLGDNNLEGALPAWVGQNLDHLIVLRLQANKLQGNIPSSFCDLLHLQVLDLSKNNITGKIPQCLNHIIALSNMKFPREPIFYSMGGYFTYADTRVGQFGDKATLAWKGENREYGKNLGYLTTIDLSCNHLTGEIPHSVAMLVALASLNLSGNNLTGFIPNNIGHMKMLESLDLSRNYLYGGIPASFSNLNFLSYMNLSFNNLSGKIPTTTQLQTFDPSTYVGNPELCGPPLSKECPKDCSTCRNDTEVHEDEFISFGFYISLGLGFITGFWGVCGTLVLKTSWRYAYFQFFNNMNDWIYVQVVLFIIRLKRRLQA